MYNILSVDGRGATQALIATKIIQIIDEKLRKSVGEGVIKHFDYITSSSTTAFPAALIAHGYTPKKTYEVVKNSFHTIFESADTSWDSYQGKFNKMKTMLQDSFKKYACTNYDKIKSYTLDNFDDLPRSCSKVNMGESKIPLLLLAAKNSQKLETHYFSSTYDKDVSLLDAVKSCIADKLHFSPHILDKQGYFDHSFISKSSLGASLSYITKAQDLTDHSLFVVNISFDNLNITDYFKTEMMQSKISPSNLLDITIASGEDINVNANRFLKGNFWNIVVTQEKGILEEVHKFDKILDDDKIENIIEGAKICSNAADECKPFYEVIDQMISDGLLHNTSIADEIDAITKELNDCM